MSMYTLKNLSEKKFSKVNLLAILYSFQETVTGSKLSIPNPWFNWFIKDILLFKSHVSFFFTTVSNLHFIYLQDPVMFMKTGET